MKRRFLFVSFTLFVNCCSLPSSELVLIMHVPVNRSNSRHHERKIGRFDNPRGQSWLNRVKNISSKWITLLVLFYATTGCSSHVAPWQRGNLAKQHMSFEPNPLHAKIRNTIHSSKEVSSGGFGSGGSGCGCN